MRQIEHAEHRPQPHHGRRVVLVLAGLKDPLNVGQAFRIASAMGVGHIYCCDGCPAPPSAKINRTARGAQHQVPWSVGDSEEIILGLRQNKHHVVAVEYATASLDIREVVGAVDRAAAVGLVLGNEAHGLSPKLLAACDAVGHLPLYGSISSLNVATALAMAVWEVVR